MKTYRIVRSDGLTVIVTRSKHYAEDTARALNQLWFEQGEYLEAHVEEALLSVPERLIQKIREYQPPDSQRVVEDLRRMLPHVEREKTPSGGLDALDVRLTLMIECAREV